MKRILLLLSLSLFSFVHLSYTNLVTPRLVKSMKTPTKLSSNRLIDHNLNNYLLCHTYGIPKKIINSTFLSKDCFFDSRHARKYFLNPNRMTLVYLDDEPGYYPSMGFWYLNENEKFWIDEKAKNVENLIIQQEYNSQAGQYFIDGIRLSKLLHNCFRIKEVCWTRDGNNLIILSEPSSKSTPYFLQLTRIDLKNPTINTTKNPFTINGWESLKNYHSFHLSNNLNHLAIISKKFHSEGIDSTIEVYSSFKRLFSKSFKSTNIKNLAWSPDDKMLAVATGLQEPIKILDSKTGRCISSFFHTLNTNELLSDIAWSSKTEVVSYSEGIINYWSLDDKFNQSLLSNLSKKNLTNLKFNLGWNND